MTRYRVTLGNKVYEVEVERSGETPAGGHAAVLSASETTAKEAGASSAHAQTASPPAVQARESAPKEQKDKTPVEAPMPGTILDVRVMPGQTVKAGQVVVILEAMKMENEIVAPENGKVARVDVKKGDSVQTGQTLIFVGGEG